MRRIRSATIVFLILLLLMSGCDSAGVPETTIPPESTLPVETTLPPETTVPPETTLPAETEPSEPRIEDNPYHDAFLQDGFIHIQGTPHLNGSGEANFYSVYYLYTDDSPVVELAALDITLNIPKEWLNRVYIIQNAEIINGQYYGYAYIVNREILDGYRDYADAEEMLFGLPDYILHLSAMDITELNRDSLDFYRSEESYLGETEGRVFFVYFGSGGGNMRQMLIDIIGQDAYDDMVGDLIITREDLDGLVTIHNEIDPYE